MVGAWSFPTPCPNYLTLPQCGIRKCVAPHVRKCETSQMGVGTKFVAILVASALSAAPAQAQFTADPPAGPFLDRVKAGDEFALLLIGAYQNAFSWANVDLGAQGKPMIYCQPPKLALATDQVVSILRHHLAANPAEAKFPLGLVMKDALKAAFPCG